MTGWNHNNHYHKYIFRNLSKKKSAAIDIGSGDGSFAEKLSILYQNVVCLEPDKSSYIFSKNNYLNNPALIHENKYYNEYISTKQFDLMTCIASIHHMDFEKTLIKMKKNLSYEGKIIILGLYKEATILDYLCSLVAIIPNKIRNKSNKVHINADLLIKTKSANMNIKEIKKISDRILIKYKFKRHLYWRYSIIYTKKK